MLHPRQLLVNVCGPVHSRPETKEHWLGIGGGYTKGYGTKHEDAAWWPELKNRLIKDAKVIGAFATAKSVGLVNGRIVESSEHNMHSLNCRFDLTKDAPDRIRAVAFSDKDQFPGDSEEWQQRFDLYLKQNWIRDDQEREFWRKSFPLVDWPSPPRELWPD